VASSRQQFNVRMTDETVVRVHRLHSAVARALGVPITQAQFLVLAVAALEEKHRAVLDAPAPPPVAPVAPAPPRPRGRPRKTPTAPPVA
jgi:hypothetical protein